MTENDEKVIITLPSPTGKGQVEMDAWPPTPEQLMLFASAMGDQNRVAAAMVDILEDVFEEDQFQEIRARLRARRNDPARLTIQDLIGVVEQLMESVSDFPTEPDSASSPPPKPIGRRSTGRVHSPASTQRGSQQAAS